MKNTIYKTIALALFFTGFNSCKKGDDLYVSPNAPLIATPASMLSAIEVGTFSSLESGAVRIASIFMQNNSGVYGQAVQPEQYQPIESDMDNYWNTIYPTMLNCKLLGDNFGAVDPNYRGIGRVLMAMNLGLATDMWGDVPYAEAFQGASGNLTPHYDPQQTILSDIQTLLDGAIVDLANTTNNVVPAGDDFIFKGNTAAWAKVAHTLKARYLMRLSKKSTFNASTIITELNLGIAGNADNCYAVHGSAASATNQWTSFLNNRTGYVVASQTLIDSMGNMADPRTPCYFDTTGMGNIAVGNVLGNYNSGVSNWGPYLGGFDNTGTNGPGSGATNQAKSIVLVSYAEALFLKAEAESRLSNPAAVADLNAAITASISEVTGTPFSGTLPVIYSAANTSVHTIILEKWKAMFADPVESYSDYRRTGYPVLAMNPSGLLPYIPKRLPTPEQERTTNSNAPTPALSLPVWYAQ